MFGTQPSPSVQLDRTKGTDALGLQRPVWATLFPEGLLLHDTEGGQVLVEPRQIRRIRTGRLTLEQSYDFETRLWTEGAQRPLILVVHWRKLLPYRQVMGGIAAMVAAEHGIRRLERGTSVLEAFLAPLVAGTPLVACAAIIAFSGFTHLSLWQRLAIPLAVLAFTALVALLWRRGRPRQVRDIDDYLRAMTLPRFWPKSDRPSPEDLA